MDQLESKHNPSITAGDLNGNHIYSDTNALSEKVREAIQKEDLEEKTVVAPKMETFVSGSIIPTIVCDDLVKFYNDDNSPFPILEGMIGRVQEGNESGTAITDKTEKDSRDMSIHWQVKDYRIGNFYRELHRVFVEYRQRYVTSQSLRLRIYETFNIQKYPKGVAYFKWNSEIVNTEPKSAMRALAWMTYLNDVEEGGETVFFNQQLVIKPKKGHTYIWPADWTHTHKGNPAPNEEKMIATGWYEFY